MPGRPFLQIPGPTLVPDRVMRAMSQPLIDHRGPQFANLLKGVLEGLKKVFQTSSGEIVLNPGSGTGAWESCLVNTLSPGDRVLGCVNGHFSARVEVPYGAAMAAEQVEERLRADKDRRLRAVLVLHCETSTGVVTDIGAIRRAMDRADHPALLLVDVVSSLASVDFAFDEWRGDVAPTG